MLVIEEGTSGDTWISLGVENKVDFMGRLEPGVQEWEDQVGRGRGD